MAGIVDLPEKLRYRRGPHGVNRESEATEDLIEAVADNRQAISRRLNPLQGRGAPDSRLTGHDLRRPPVAAD